MNTIKIDGTIKEINYINGFEKKFCKLIIKNEKGLFEITIEEKLFTNFAIDESIEIFGELHQSNYIKDGNYIFCPYIFATFVHLLHQQN